MKISFNHKTILNFLDYLCKILFSNGWGFIFPYLFFYLHSWYFDSKISNLYNIFIFLHIFNSLLLIYFVYKNRHKLKFKTILFWLILGLIFMLPRAYLEYPSDPWAHFQRIFSFQDTDFIKDSYIKEKFLYFWGWTLMSHIEPIYRRFALDIYSTFWQLLFYYQFYLLALKLGFDEYWSKIQVLGVLFLFGTYIWTFRYYAISSTIVAYIAYVAALIILIEIQHKKYKFSGFILPLILIMYYNHIQEVMLLGISAISLIVDSCLQANKKATIKSIILIFIISYVFGFYAINYTNLGHHPLWNTHDNDYYISIFGNFKIWVTHFSYFQTAGLHGVLAILFSLVFFRKNKTISILTLTPYFLLLLPIFAFLFTKDYSRLSSNWVTYRPLYSFPTSFMFIIGVRECLNRFRKRNKFRILKDKILNITVVLIIFLIPPHSPFRGRFWFQIYKPSQELSLKNLDVTAQWFYENKKLKNSCLLASDRVTQFLLNTHFGLIGRYPHRTKLYNISDEIKTQQDLAQYIRNNNVCRFLVVPHDQLPEIPSSKVAQLSGHWDPDLVKNNMTFTSEFEALVDTSLKEKGWKKTFVPPFYWLYEAPQEK